MASLTLRLAVLNLANKHDHPDWPLRKEIIAAEFRRRQVDYALLQEVRCEPGAPDMASELAEELGLQCSLSIAQYYDPLTMEPVDRVTSVWEGVAVLSAERPRFAGTLNLKKPALSEDNNLRVTQRVDIPSSSSQSGGHSGSGGGGGLALFNVHFSTDPIELQSNLRETLVWMRQRPLHCLCAGDMNALPPAISPLFAREKYVDVWTALHPNEPGFTFSSVLPLKRIDYVWVPEQLVKSVIAVELMFSQPVDGIYASDHLGLYVELELEK
jgi:endonuclease/exonuclease/phosphatase family metal-dependent hydrolase